MRYNKKERKSIIVPKDWRKKQLIQAASYHLLRKGILVKSPCVVCSKEPAEMIHTNYDDPRAVLWMCRKHGRQYHAEKRSCSESVDNTQVAVSA